MDIPLPIPKEFRVIINTGRVRAQANDDRTEGYIAQGWKSLGTNKKIGVAAVRASRITNRKNKTNAIVNLRKCEKTGL